MSTSDVFVVLMAGGSGTRFWPASRKALPKQFLPIAGRKAMIRETFDRLRGFVPPERVLVVAGERHAALVRKFLPRLPAENLLCEPAGRNTAPCIAWAACEIERRAARSVQVVLPSDHVIQPARRFREQLAAAAEEAAAGDVLLTLGVKPTHPATGYGYIECGALLHERRHAAVHEVARFVEKPDRARAEQFLATGRFLWNAGIFVWSTSSILAALQQCTPATLAGARAIVARRTSAALAELWPTLPAAAIDVAVLEKAHNVRVVPVDFQWNDVGSWTALPEVHARDEHGHCVAGGAGLVASDAADCIAYGPRGHVIALLGVRDLVVVHAGKVTLVCPRERAQDVRALVAAMEARDAGFV